MRLDTSQHMRTEMRLRMAPRMIQSMEILQLPLMALQERIDQELIENPVLIDLREESPDQRRDQDEDYGESDRGGEPLSEFPAPGHSSDDGETGASSHSEEAASRAEAAEKESDVDPAAASVADVETREPEIEAPADPGFDDFDDDWPDRYNDGHSKSRASLAEESDRKLDAMLNMPSRPVSLQDELLGQLGYLDCDPTVHALAEMIIQNLDETGYFPRALEDLARESGLVCTMDQAEEALAIVQSLEPSGVGARDLRECLLLQLTPEIPRHDVLQILISRYMDDLEQNRLPLIERKSGIPMAAIKDALEQLKRLNPRPGAAYSSESAQYVVPDLSVEKDENGEYVVRLEDEYTPRLAISPLYQKMLRNKSSDPQAREFLSKRIQSARWLIESIEQRRTTLLKVAKAIIQHQKEFLDHGPDAIQPLKMQQIADLVGVHVTTVSRAVDDKWVQTPRGIFALKRFFGGGTTTTDGEEVAWDTIKQKLLEVISQEDKANPLSDEEIVEELGQRGLPVARRTVTKYRKALKIRSSRQRKQH